MKYYYNDMVEPNQCWAGLVANVESSDSAKFHFQTLHKNRFRLVVNEKKLLWGVFEQDWYGVNILKVLSEWEHSQTPVPPISSFDVEAACQALDDEKYRYWTRYF